MIFGIGTDLTHIPRMHDLLEKYDDKIAKRILSDHEFECFQKSTQPAAFLAKRFAAKEAVAKALGTGFRDGLSLRHIEVRNNNLGCPELVFYKVAQNLIEHFGISKALISLSDEGDYALAFATLLAGEA